MKMKVGLETVVSEMPEMIVKNRDQSYLDPLVPEPLRGIFKWPDEIRRFKNNDAAEILAEKVARKALDRAGLKPPDVDYIIANNCGGKYPTPLIACYIHNKLGFPIETPILNVQNACSSFVDACWVAWNLILAGTYKRILVVTVSAWETTGGNGRADLTDPMSACLGDGAGAAIVSSQNLKCEFLSYYNRTFGEVYDWVGCTMKPPAHPELKQAEDQPPVSNYLFGTPEFWEWWQRMGEQFGIDNLKGALKLANMTLSDLGTIIFHQPADMLYDIWIEGAAKAGVSKNKWKHTWEKYGNLTSAVPPVNLAEFWENGELKKDSIIAVMTLGAGISVPTMIIRWLV